MVGYLFSKKGILVLIFTSLAILAIIGIQIVYILSPSLSISLKKVNPISPSLDLTKVNEVWANKDLLVHKY